MNDLKFKVVAADFDGTLLKSDDTVSQKTVDTIGEFIGRGGKFYVATGRMHCSIAARLKELGIDGLDMPVISYQGALVKTAKSDSVLFNRPLNRALAVEILEFLARQNVYYHAYVGDIMIVDNEQPWTKIYADAVKVDYKIIDNLTRFIQKNIPDTAGSGDNIDVCHKIISIIEAEKLPGIMDKCNEYFAGRAQFNASMPHLMECVDISAGKDKAIEHLIKAYGLGLEDVLAVGDSLNDYTMVARAGMGVAMGNAMPELIKAAKAVTLSNDEDGVAAAIEKYCF